MADTKREIERKYEGPAAEGDEGLPELTGVKGVASVIDKGVAELDATYYDTADQRLAAASLTLRRRTGGDERQDDEKQDVTDHDFGWLSAKWEGWPRCERGATVETRV